MALKKVRIGIREKRATRPSRWLSHSFQSQNVEALLVFSFENKDFDSKNVQA
jgi:hypothetical protein